MPNYDCSGWATRTNILCSDGRTILPNAFLQNDGQTVPLVWNHQHDDATKVLGHAYLENRDDGVYAYCTFNESDSGQAAKMLVEHGDVDSLSIYANQLKESNGKVYQGNIRELSLVLAGANMGAHIDNVIKHGALSDREAYIYTGDYIHLAHSANGEEGPSNAQELFDTLTDEQKELVYALIAAALDADVEDEEDYEEDDDMIMHSDYGYDDFDYGYDEYDDFDYDYDDHDNYDDFEDDYDDDFEDDYNDDFEDDYDDDFEDGYDFEDAYEDGYEDGLEHAMYGGDFGMKYNVFDNSMDYDAELMHSAEEEIIGAAPAFGTLSESFLAHADDYGIDNVEFLFPNEKDLDMPPTFIGRETGWVARVMNGVHHTPFSRIRSMFADITEDEARAKGYLKGKLKKEEVFSLLKRSTTPTTVYKKQKMDRDDQIDITDFDVVAWLKKEMRLMLDEEIARAILIGDGRLASDDDHIDQTHIRPIVSDADLFVIRWGVASGSTTDEKCKNFIRAAIKARKNYRGSGNPTLFTTEDWLTDLLLMEDTIGHKLYKTEAELATALRVSSIVTVPVMENFTDADSKEVYGIIVNLQDYNVGADKGGSINMFEDFDIDFNQQKYLIETRCSGALTKPFSAIVLRAGDTTASEEPTTKEAMDEFR